jgi:diguanylate cyclase (GGDEF)-like protein
MRQDLERALHEAWEGQKLLTPPRRKEELGFNLGAADYIIKPFYPAVVRARVRKRAFRMGHPLSVIMMDIDNFKAYNDNYGHGAGDECLQRVARALRENLPRSGDFVARYGGEEFVALLPCTEGEGALQVAERLREVVVSLEIPHAYSPTAGVVTISLGVASSGALASPEEAAALLKRADQGLYRSKREGRNRCTLLEEPK